MNRRIAAALAALAIAAGLAAAPQAQAVGPPTVTVIDAVAVEGHSQADLDKALFIVVNTSDAPTTIRYNTEDGFAIPRVNMTTPFVAEAEHGKDYPRQVDGELTIPGNASHSIEIPVTAEPGDDDDEPFEFFHLVIETMTPNVDRVTLTANATIIDDDIEGGVPPVPSLDAEKLLADAVGMVPKGLPKISVVDAVRAEGDHGTPVMRFKVATTQPLPVAVALNYATTDGTAEGGEDYLDASGDVTIPAGKKEAWIDVRLLGDSIHEDRETFDLGINSLAWWMFIADGQATGTIANDDPVPSLRVTNVRVREGKRAVFRVLASNGSEDPVSFAYKTDGKSADAGDDFAQRNGSRQFDGPNDLVETISVPVRDDDTDEDRERFLLRLSSARGARFADPTGVARIIDND